MIGTKLAHYEITSHIGSGGMGDVYQATDTKLGRSVAIKFLPDAFSHDTERVARFQREARVLASLNHPNIAAIHGVEEIDKRHFLVMELVPGETLADRIKRGAIALDEAIPIARQIADALEAAHEQGIIHRDLKPANIKVRDDGTVKVLDFGLAKALEPAGATSNASQSPTITSPAMTQAGMILGTAAYMSPEQARGRGADQRGDVFSFGCVLYEMLTGRQAFQGDDVSDVLASVLKTEPDFSLLPAKLHPRIHESLRRCLQKNPKLRWHAIGDARVEIEAAIADPHGLAGEELHVAAVKPLWKRAIPVVVGVILAAALTGVAVWNLKPSPPLHVARFSLTLGEGQQFTAGALTPVAISPDGTEIVYEANRQLYHRSLKELEARPIPGSQTPQLVGNPVFSPDGRSIVFGHVADLTLKRVVLGGGAAVTICPFDNLYGMSWGEDGILFSQTAGIMRVSPNGGKPEIVVAVKNGEIVHGPQVLPGGQSVLFTLAKGQATDRWDNAQIVVQSLKSGERTVLIERGSDARYVPTGHLVYAFGGTLFAVPFDLRKMQVTGGQVPVVEGVRRSVNNYSGAAHYSFSSNGTLIYVPGPVSTALEQDAIAMMDRKGTLDILRVPARPFRFTRVSPDGKRIAFESTDGKGDNIWIYELGGAAAPRQLTVGGSNRYPVWSGDGERVTFQSNREGDAGIFWQRADGAGAAERLTKPEQNVAHVPDSWSGDGQFLSYTAAKGNEAALWIYSLKDKKATLFAQAPPASTGRSAFSRDGKWLAYQSSESGVRRVWVQPFPATGAKYPIADGGQPFWSSDGKELFYNAGVGLTVAVNIMTNPSFAFSEPMPVARGLRMTNPLLPRSFDITPNGQHFIGASLDRMQSGSPEAPQIHVTLNWFRELQQRVPVK